ncbi:hypothetical protein [Bacillus phage SDFMU_Pbc]|uniref:Uncharacterized protein n=1 Tax=Bacillus phage SDFMU_Pbc TaxID=3076135 RepID=A0AA96QY94_9CAUD|nr:hypothetical protein [Bacillus phage SDFMU_Pbc]
MTHSQTVVNKMFKLAKDEYECDIPIRTEEIGQLKEKIAECQRLIENLEVERAEAKEFVNYCCKTHGFAEGFFKHPSREEYPSIPSLFFTRNDAKYAEGKTKYEWSQDERLQGRDLSAYGHIETPRARRS